MKKSLRRSFDLYEKRQPIDVMTLTNYLKEQDKLTEVGGSSYLADLTNQVTTASHVVHYATHRQRKENAPRSY